MTEHHQEDSSCPSDPTLPISLIIDGSSSSVSDDVESNNSTLKNKGELNTQHSHDHSTHINTLHHNDDIFKGKIPYESKQRKDPIGSRFFRFLFHNGVPSHSLRFLLTSLFLFSLFFLSRNSFFQGFAKSLIIYGTINIFSIVYLLAWFFLMISCILIILHSFVVTCHRYRIFYENRLMHYINELEVHISFIITCIISYSLLNSNTISKDLLPFIDKIINLLFSLFLASFLLALKRHYITVLAISFNFNNYKDRIQDSIFGDKIISSLLRARSVYKNRMKKKYSSNNLHNLFAPAIQLFGGAGGSWGRGGGRGGGNKDDIVTAANNVTVNGMVMKRRGSLNSSSKTVPNGSGIVFSGASIAHLRNNLADDTRKNVSNSTNTLPLSAMNIFSPIKPPPSSVAEDSGISDNNTFSSLPLINQAVEPEMKEGHNEDHHYHHHHHPHHHNTSVPDYLSESDKKRQFEEFSRLANTTITRFSNLTDYRIEIKSESERLGSKVFKYLQSQSELTDNIPETDNVYGAHMIPWFKEDFCRSIALLKRHSEKFSSLRSLAPLTEKEASLTSFTCEDICLAFEGILIELYQTAKSLQTIETAIEKVDHFITFIIGLFVVIVLSITMFNAIELLLAITTMLSSAAFAFSTSAKNMFESMIFLLVIHPFDVGDRVFIPLGGNNLGHIGTLTGSVSNDGMDNLVVSEMHLLSTSFERWDGVKIYIPNYLLSSKPIVNIRRSGPLIEVQKIMIDFSTPLSKIDTLRYRLHKWVTEDQVGKSMFTSLSRVCVESVENCNRLNLNIFFQHQMNWQDLDGHLERRSKMVCFLNENIAALDIGYMPPIQRVAIINSEKQSLRRGESTRLGGSSLV